LSLQPHPSKVNLTHSLPHLGGQTESGIWTPYPAKPPGTRQFPQYLPAKAELRYCWIRHVFAIFRAFAHRSEYVGPQAFSLP
jgi:hypothetical protein